MDQGRRRLPRREIEQEGAGEENESLRKPAQWHLEESHPMNRDLPLSHDSLVTLVDKFCGE